MKFGVYSDTGNTTCEGYPGSWGHESLDARDYASWGVDYLKLDYCGMDAVSELLTYIDTTPPSPHHTLCIWHEPGSSITDFSHLRALYTLDYCGMDAV